MVVSVEPRFCDNGLLNLGMNITSAIFDCSAPDLDSCPDESLPEFAFIGRSNVGKSSLLNLLAGQDGLARVSPVPGHTKLINIFTMNQTLAAGGPAGLRVRRRGEARQGPVQPGGGRIPGTSHQPLLVFALIDSGLPPQEIDVEFVDWLTRHAVPFVLVFTKTDKSPPPTVQANIAAFMARIAQWFDQPPAIFSCSAVTNQGKEALLGAIEESMTAIRAEAAQTPISPESPPASGLKAGRPKKRPDRQRPW